MGVSPVQLRRDRLLPLDGEGLSATRPATNPGDLFAGDPVLPVPRPDGTVHRRALAARLPGPVGRRCRADIQASSRAAEPVVPEEAARGAGHSASRRVASDCERGRFRHRKMGELRGRRAWSGRHDRRAFPLARNGRQSGDRLRILGVGSVRGRGRISARSECECVHHRNCGAADFTLWIPLRHARCEPGLRNRDLPSLDRAEHG